MMYHESMTIPSLYTADEQGIIDRWMSSTPVYPGRDALHDASAVAEIALFSVQERLPQGLSVREDGFAAYSRKTWDCPVRMRGERLFPMHLFDIDRDDSPMDIACPESYFATFLPGYNVYVITLSQGSSETYGCFDLAIDCFQSSDDPAQIAANAKLVLKSWWKYQHKELHAPCWKGLLKSGLIDEHAALCLRDQVWPRVENPDSVLS